MKRGASRPHGARAAGRIDALVPVLLLSVQFVACAAPASEPGASPEPEPVDRTERVEIDGARLWLMVRGADRTAPILLWLHGGPGGAETPLFRLFDGDLEQHFVVAYWDQRGAGRSFDPDADPSELTIARHLADLRAVVERLTSTLPRNDVVLVGHSWGSALGLLYAEQRPGDVAAFVGVGQFTSLRAQQEAQLAFVRAEASRLGDDDALERTSEIGPPPYDATRQLALERLVDRYGGLFHRKPSFTWAVTRGILRGYVAPWEIPRFIRANEISLAAMNEELLALDLRPSVRSVAVPVYFFLGRYDRQVDARLAAAWLEQLEAPSKRLVWFEQSAHNIPFEEPERFVRTIVDLLR